MRSDLISAGLMLSLWLVGLGVLALTPAGAVGSRDADGTRYYGYSAGNTIYPDVSGNYTVVVRGLRPISQ